MSRVPFDIEFLLEGILDESPDTVRVGDTTHEWTDPDAHGFMIFDTFSVIARNAAHYNIMTKLSSVAHAVGSGEHEMSMLSANGKMFISDEAAAVAELKNPNSQLNKYFVKYRTYDGGMRYRTELGLAGRLWTRSKVIAFWNDSSKVKSRWKDVRKMFERFQKIIGDLDEYQIDLIERANSRIKPLEPVQSMRGTDPNQTNFMKTLFGGEEKLNNKQIGALQQKIHTLPPEKKKAALAMLGAKNYKAREIADKLGISVAEFNHLMQVNEDSVPSLMEILKEIQHKKL